MKGTEVAVFYEKQELDAFLLEHDVLSVQHSHSIHNMAWGERHDYTGVWVVWYKKD
jgi:hypothetical protein